MTQPLNPTLYRQLQNALGDIVIDKQGESFHAVVGTRATTGKKFIHQKNPGEAYRVNCPFCGDTRQRLYINHMWLAGFGGLSTDHLLSCFNEDCTGTWANKKKLIESVSNGVRLASAQIIQGVVMPETVIHPMPGDVIPINQVPAQAPVRTYLEERGFDLDELAKEWGVLWITRHTDEDLLQKSLKDSYRLLFPVYGYRGKELGLLGWQLRYFDSMSGSGTPPNKRIPKYYTRGKVGNTLYNGYRARGGSTVCVCEGVLDAIKFGWDIAVCTFGKNIGTQQKKLLWANWGADGAHGVEAYDTDVLPDCPKAVAKLKKERDKLDEFFKYWPNYIKIPFPVGYDPGDYTRTELRQMLIDRGADIPLHLKRSIL